MTASRLEHVEPVLRDGVRQGGGADRAQPRVRPVARRRADDLPEHRRARLHAPRRVVQAAEACLRGGRTQYTQATGLPELRERIAAWYGTRFGLDIDAHAHRGHGRRVGGAAAGLPGALRGRRRGADADPATPATATSSPLQARDSAGCCRRRREARFQLDAAGVRAHWNAARPRRAAGLALQPHRHFDRAQRVAAVADSVRAHGGVTLVDEIYLGLSYDSLRPQARWNMATTSSPSTLSSCFGMTGWRLGWMVTTTRAGGAGGEAGTEPLHLRVDRGAGRRRWPASTTSSSTNAAETNSAAAATSSCPRCARWA